VLIQVKQEGLQEELNESVGYIRGDDIIGNLRKLHRETSLFLLSVVRLEMLNR
jgi:hypothetical protein